VPASATITLVVTDASERRRILIGADTGCPSVEALAVLQETPHEVIQAEGAEIAPLLEKGGRWDLLIAQIEPPDLAGFEAIKSYRRKLGDDAPILALSASFKREHIEGMLENVGVRRLLAVDIRPEELLFWVNHALFPDARRSRKAPRMPASFVLSLAGQQSLVSARASSLSEAGLFLETEGVAALGEILEVKFQVPSESADAAEIVAKCEVVWSNVRPEGGVGHPPYGMGLRFVGLAPEDRRAIQACVVSNLLDSSI